MMSTREISKKIVSALVQYGTGTIVYSIIQKNVDTDRIDHKIAVGASSIALGGLVSDAASQRSDKLVDEIFDRIAEIKVKLQK